MATFALGIFISQNVIHSAAKLKDISIRVVGIWPTNQIVCNIRMSDISILLQSPGM